MDTRYLVHYGIQGQKWGERRYQNKDGTWTEEGKLRRRIGNPQYVNDDGSLTDQGRVALRKARSKNKHLDESDRNEFGITSYQAKGGTIKKGEALYRITDNTVDRTAKNRKYFSTNPTENNAWAQMFGDQFRRYNTGTYSLMYVPVKDLKVSSNAQLGKEFYEKVLKKDLKNINMDYFDLGGADYGYKDTVNKDDINDAFDVVMNGSNRTIRFNKSKMKTVKDRDEALGSVASTMIAIQCKQGEEAVKAMLAAGYDAIPDVNGTDVSYDPIIVLNPDTKVQRVSTLKIPDQNLSKGFVDERWPIMRP